MQRLTDVYRADSVTQPLLKQGVRSKRGLQLGEWNAAREAWEIEWDAVREACETQVDEWNAVREAWGTQLGELKGAQEAWETTDQKVELQQQTNLGGCIRSNGNDVNKLSHHAAFPDAATDQHFKNPKKRLRIAGLTSQGEARLIKREPGTTTHNCGSSLDGGPAVETPLSPHQITDILG